MTQMTRVLKERGQYSLPATAPRTHTVSRPFRGTPRPATTSRGLAKTIGTASAALRWPAGGACSCSPSSRALRTTTTTTDESPSRWRPRRSSSVRCAPHFGRRWHSRALIGCIDAADWRNEVARFVCSRPGGGVALRVGLERPAECRIFHLLRRSPFLEGQRPASGRRGRKWPGGRGVSVGSLISRRFQV